MRCAFLEPTAEPSLRPRRPPGLGAQDLTGSTGGHRGQYGGPGDHELSGTYSLTGEGKFFYTMMAAFTELERDINHERTMAGLAAARAQGNVGGRPTVMDADKLVAAKARRARGESPTQIARALGVSAPPYIATSRP